MTNKQRCRQPLDPGPCEGHKHRYYYDPIHKKCKQFVYGGCKGNDNNFESFKECLHFCKGLCYLPPVTGPCKAKMPRFYYNSTSNQCQGFIYGGCGGNANNFKTKKACHFTCVEKPGVCRKAPPGTITICPVRCGSDWECKGKQKCCPYGCMIDCMDPI
ncbi:BPTI/Kunitz domain-containing protein-like isoform X1 [Erythrolamprus reginae]|uniref:BPTI/Kunitz domain-containing protein-like isoform X1 n=1 Tax=Erythrolamprus reginae TaxID=121349 RepID=UPI00396CD670